MRTALRVIAVLAFGVALGSCGGGAKGDGVDPGAGSNLLLRNDNWAPGNTFVVLTTLVATEEAAVVLGPVVDPFKAMDSGAPLLRTQSPTILIG